MMLSFEVLDLELSGLYPNSVRRIGDSVFYVPDSSDVETLLFRTYFEKYRYTAELFDCDDFALVLHAYVVQERYRQMVDRNLTKEQWLPWPFGEAWASRLNGVANAHAVNLCRTRQGWKIYEPQNDSARMLDPIVDDFHFVRL